MANGKFPVEAKVGIFVAIAIAGLIYLTTQINRSGFSFSGHKTITAIFSNASGLLPRTSIEYAGIRVGMVDRIYLEDGKAKVIMKLQPDTLIYEDTVVSLRSRGILGEKIIMINGGGALPEVPDGGIINAHSTAGDFDTAMQNFNEVAEAVKDLLKGGGGKPSIQDILGNVTEITDDLKTLVKSNRQDLNDIVKNVHSFTSMLNDGDLKEMIKNLKTTSEMIRSFVQTADPQLKDVVKDFGSVMTKINSTVDSLNRIVAKVERGEGTIGKLVNDESTVNKVNDTLDGINDFVGRVKRLEVAVGFRGAYLGNAGQIQSTASFRIQPNFDKYFLFEFTNGPLELNTAKTTITDTGTGALPGSTPTPTQRTVEKERKNQFMFTLLFARRFYDLTVKAGIIQSSGGVGAEYHLFHDRLSFSAEAFDFAREMRPHLRAYATVHLWKILKLSGGVDDIIIENGKRNFFGGAGLMITDSDLKSLLGVAPLVSSTR